MLQVQLQRRAGKNMCSRTEWRWFAERWFDYTTMQHEHIMLWSSWFKTRATLNKNTRFWVHSKRSGIRCSSSFWCTSLKTLRSFSFLHFSAGNWIWRAGNLNSLPKASIKRLWIDQTELWNALLARRKLLEPEVREEDLLHMRTKMTRDFDSCAARGRREGGDNRLSRSWDLMQFGQNKGTCYKIIPDALLCFLRRNLRQHKSRFSDIWVLVLGT